LLLAGSFFSFFSLCIFRALTPDWSGRRPLQALPL
jgi:hypothetical protein